MSPPAADSDAPTPRERLTDTWAVAHARALDIAHRAGLLADEHGRALRPHECALYRRIEGDAHWYSRCFERWQQGRVLDPQKRDEFETFNLFSAWAMRLIYK